MFEIADRLLAAVDDGRQLAVATAVSIDGSAPRTVDAARTTRKLALVSAGIGITPIRTLLEDARFAPGDATVLLRASTLAETYLWDEVRAIAAAKGALVYTSVGHRGTGMGGWLSDEDARRGVTLGSVFPGLVDPHAADTDLYVCGPSAWLDLVEREAVHAGVSRGRIHAERFDW